MSSFVVCHQIKLQSLSETHPDSSESISQSKTNDFVELSRHAGAWERSRFSLQKEPVNDFPPCFKVLNDKKNRGLCLYVLCLCCCLEPFGRGWFPLCVCECKQCLGSTAVHSCVMSLRGETPKGCCLSIGTINKTLQGSFKPVALCFFSGQSCDQSH